MRIIYPAFTFCIFSLYFHTALADDFNNEHVYKSNEFYYLSIEIPEDIRKINFHARTCNIYMSSFYLGNSYSLSEEKSHSIINEECSFLRKNIEEVKLKFRNDEKMTQLLSMANDTAKIYSKWMK